jgi:DNA modification methylase
MIPERFAMAMIDDGWVLRNKIVWYKRNGMPSSVKDRLSNKWEYVFFFTKAQKYYFDLDSIRKLLEESSIKRISQKNIPNQFKSGKSVEFAKTDPVNNIPKILNNMHQKYQQNGAYQGSHSGYFNDDGSLRVNQNGTNPGDVISQPAVRHKSWASNPGHKFTHERKYDPDADGGDFFDIPTRAHSFAHFAVFPETFVEPFIKAGCPSNGIVLDPFAGSGTVGVVAMKQEKNAILIEISPEYCNIIKKRLNWDVGLGVEYEHAVGETVK